MTALGKGGPSPSAALASPPQSFIPGPSLQRIARWGARGGLALADQALFAGAQFVLSVLLARWLSAVEYGAFALAYSAFLLVAALYGALLLEPMPVFGPSKYRCWRRGYLGVLLRGHLVVSMPAGVLLVLGALVAGALGAPAVKSALLVLGLVTPILLLATLTRRMFYLELRPGRAVIGSAIYFTLTVGLAFWLFRSALLSPMTAILAMTLAAFAAAATQIIQLRPQWPADAGSQTADVVRDHWQYGRWALASAVAVWFPLNIYYLVLPVWTGLETVGMLKAVMNLANPMLHSLIASSMLLVPLLVRHRARGGTARMQRTVRRLAGVFLIGAALYVILLWTFRFEVVNLLYGGRYPELSSAPIALIGILLLVASLRSVLGSALRALEQPDRLFWSYGAAVGLSLIVGLPLATQGVTGALAGLLIADLAFAAMAVAFLRRARDAAANEAVRPVDGGVAHSFLSPEGRTR